MARKHYFRLFSISSPLVTNSRSFSWRTRLCKRKCLIVRSSGVLSYTMMPMNESTVSEACSRCNRTFLWMHIRASFLRTIFSSQVCSKSGQNDFMPVLLCVTTSFDVSESTLIFWVRSSHCSGWASIWTLNAIIHGYSRIFRSGTLNNRYRRAEFDFIRQSIIWHTILS
jgi:hypothetical protein